ncbi:hypothetical protein AMAG_07922 [Allomyces macrogynus ATCC 38327]|uniref:Nuclear segregation protein Bfr1 n=1 Tax=Allomyces macrogynus (strain ATCC 38327) TaxID=578462 RepID=A0A0L0SJT1_ALLM3|nr:hypothetical protein AMAG_07922 [Allomyces macrogynus ATCC 38327]|eukprot:KNE62737.1 hypothetical protein AMAG_07922 [Allomyces macrogynus ATCC 38327]
MSSTASAAPTSRPASTKPSGSHGRVAPKPDQDKHNALIKDLNAKMDAIRQKMTEIRNQTQLLNSAAADRTATTPTARGGDKRQDLRSKLETVKKQQDELVRTKEDLLKRLLVLNTSVKARTEELNAISQRFGYSSLDAVQARIQTLEAKIASGTLKLIDERKAANELAQLQRCEPLFATRAAKEKEIEQDRAEIAAVEAKLATLQPSAGGLAQSFEDVKKELDSLALAKKQAYDKAQDLYKQRNALQDQLAKLTDERNRAQDAFRAATEEHYKTLREERERKAKRLADQRKQMERERVEEIAQEELERAAVPAYEDEMAICRNLIAYLQQHPAVKGSGIKVAAAAAKANAAGSASTGVPAHAIRKVDTAVPAGATLLKRDDGAGWFNVTPKKGGKKNKGGAAAPAARAAESASAESSGAATPSSSSGPAFKFPLTVMENFWKVKVDVPVTAADAPVAIAALNQKLHWFQTHQKLATLRNQALAKARIDKLKAEAGLLDPKEAQQQQAEAEAAAAAVATEENSAEDDAMDTTEDAARDDAENEDVQVDEATEAEAGDAEVEQPADADEEMPADE